MSSDSVSSDSSTEASDMDLDDSGSDTNIESESSSQEISSDTEDEKDSLLPESFREKEDKMEFSDWCLSRLRKFLLGQPITKEERTKLTVSYF